MLSGTAGVNGVIHILTAFADDLVVPTLGGKSDLAEQRFPAQVMRAGCREQDAAGGQQAHGHVVETAIGDAAFLEILLRFDQGRGVQDDEIELLTAVA